MHELFIEEGIRSAKELAEMGVTRRAISIALDNGVIEKFCRGFYYKKDADRDGNFELAMVAKIADALVWKITAAQLHGMSDSTQHCYDLLVSSEKAAKYDFGHLTVRLSRTRRTSTLWDDVEYKGENGIGFRVTNKPRTVIDLFKSRAGRQEQVEAVRSYISNGYDLSLLLELAGKNNHLDEISSMVDGVLAVMDAGRSLSL